MDIYIICVGKIKEKYINEGISEFSKRLKPFVNFNVIELKEYSKESNINLTISKETDEIIKTISKIDSYKILLDLKGKEFSSEEMAKKIQDIVNLGNSSIAFIIGGSNGVATELKEKVDMQLKFSDFTFPHQLMRLILTEQIYRWFSILNNGKYHK